MYLITKSPWHAVDGETGEDFLIPAGRHEVERIHCPLGKKKSRLVLKGTKIGAAENFWRKQGKNHGDLKVTIEED